MTEKEKLINFIKEGFKTHILIRNISQEEKESHLPEIYWDKDVFAVPLWREDNQKLMFYFIEKETKEYAQLLIEKGKEIIGYNLIVYISVLSDEAVNGCKVHLESIIECLNKVKGWDVRLSKYPNIFEMHFEIISGERKKIEEILEEIDKTLLMLTLKNKIGFFIASFSPGERYRHQPFSLNLGLPEVMLKVFQLKMWMFIVKNLKAIA